MEGERLGRLRLLMDCRRRRHVLLLLRLLLLLLRLPRRATEILRRGGAPAVTSVG